MRSPPRVPHKFSGPWQLFVWTLRGQPGLLAGLGLALLGVLACEVTVPRLLAEAIDAALVAKDAVRLDVAGMAIIAVVVALYFVHVLYIGLETRLLYAAMLRLRSLLCGRILQQPLDFFAKAKTGALTHTVVNDTEVLEHHGVYVFSDLPFGILTIAAVLVLMLVMDWQMTAVVVGFLAVATAVSFRLGRPLPTLRKTIQNVYSQLSAHLAEAVSGIRTVKAFGREEDERRRLDGLSREVMALEVKEGMLGAWVEPIFELMELLGVALVVWYGAHRVMDGAMTPGILVAFIAYMELLSEPVSRTGRYVRHVQASRGVMQRLVQFLDGLAPAPVAGTKTGATRHAEVSFKQVSYRYPGTQRPALDDVSFTLQPGKLVALVGRNGAGKSTLVEILLGFRTPERGAVTVGGIPVADWNPAAWQRLLGIVPQEAFLFHVSLAENIAYGSPDASRAEIERAAQQAGLAGLVKRLPEGLDTVLGDRGQKLSGGERQRVALSRLLLRNPAVVVLDEPTSSLDGEATQDIGHIVKPLSASRTVLVVAHRHETVALADRVLLLEEGAVTFDGSLAGARSQALFQRLFPGVVAVEDRAARATAILS